MYATFYYNRVVCQGKTFYHVSEVIHSTDMKLGEITGRNYGAVLFFLYNFLLKPAPKSDDITKVIYFS